MTGDLPPMPRGHRSLPHTADVIIEAWGPDLATCCEEAVTAVIEIFAIRSDAAVIAEHDVHVPHAPADDMLLDLLDEVVLAIDVADGIPVGATVRAGSDGRAGLQARLVLADPGSIEPAGAVPKAISRSGLEVTRAHGAVRCQFLVDV